MLLKTPFNDEKTRDAVWLKQSSSFFDPQYIPERVVFKIALTGLLAY